MPEVITSILSDSFRREKVLSQCDTSDDLREAFSQTEASIIHHYEVYRDKTSVVYGRIVGGKTFVRCVKLASALTQLGIRRGDVGAVGVDIGANPSAEGADEGDGIDDIVETLKLQEQPTFDKKQFVAYIKTYIKLLTPRLDAEKQAEFKKSVEGKTKFLLSKFSDL